MDSSCYPQLNRISERRNRTLLDMVQPIMSFTDLSLYLWGHALLSTVYLLNRVPSKSIPTTSYEIWHDKKLNLGHLKIWRCSVYIKRQMADKLKARSMKAHFIGYPKKSIEYYFYFLDDHNVIVSQHVMFFKKQFIQDGSNGRLIELEEKVSEKQQAIEPDKPINTKPVVVFLLYLIHLVGPPIFLKGTWICFQKMQKKYSSQEIRVMEMILKPMTK